MVERKEWLGEMKRGMYSRKAESSVMSLIDPFCMFA